MTTRRDFLAANAALPGASIAGATVAGPRIPSTPEQERAVLERLAS